MDQRRIDELEEEAYVTADGPVKVALLEEAVRLADQLGEVERAYDLRDSLMTAAVFGGSAEKMLPAFAWSLAQHDRDPERFHAHGLLWKYKWVMENLTEFPQVSRAQIASLYDDMETRYRKEGASLRPVWGHRAASAMRMGDPTEEIEAHRERFATAKRDGYADCAACETQFETEIALAIRAGDPDAVLAAAAPVTSGKRRCAEVPHMTWALLLGPLVAKGDLATADDWHRRGMRLCEDNPEHLATMSRHLAYATARGDLATARGVFERIAGWAADSRVPERRFHFFVAAQHFGAALAARGPTVKLRIPRELASERSDDAGHRSSPWREDGEYESAALAAWLAREARAIAAEFDARNGNDRYRRIAEAPPLDARGQGGET